MDRRFSRQLRFLGAVLRAHETLAEHSRALNDLLRLMLEDAQQQGLFVGEFPPVAHTLSHSLAVLPSAPPQVVPKFTPEVFHNYVVETLASAYSKVDREAVRALVERGITSGLITRDAATALLANPKP